MKKKYLFFVLLECMFLQVTLYAQYNLVPNPSFEVYDTCPNSYGKLTYAVPWTIPIHNSSPDYLNACSMNLSVPTNVYGHQFARTGVAYAAIVTAIYSPVSPQNENIREYLQVKLIDTLKSGVKYCIQFYVSSGDSSLLVSNNIGVYFSPTQVYVSGIFNLTAFTPQFENPPNNNLNDRNGWTLVSGTYTALGGEDFIVIGNFRDTTTTIVTFTSWVTNPNYGLAVYYIDDVLISPCDSLSGIPENQITKTEIMVYPIPANKKINIESKQEEIELIQIYSNLGELIYEDTKKNTLSITTIDISSFSKGLYTISILTKKKYNFKIIIN